jgi:predicted PurR-regulated permease PerM
MDEKLPGYQQNLSNQISEATILLERFGVDLSSFEAQGFLDIGRVVSFLGAAILKIGNAMFLIFVVVMTAIFMVLEASSYPDRLRHGLGVSNTVIDQYRSFAKSVNSYLLTRVKLNLALAVPVTILLFVLGVDFPIFWGVVTFFVGFIPVIGFLLAVAPPTALALIESGWVYAVIVIAGYTIINGVVDNVLQPRLIGQDLNLSPVVVFLSLFLWSFLLGGIGMLLAMPLTILTVIVFEQFEETRWLAVLMSTAPPQPIAVAVAEEEEALSPVDDP